MGLNIYKGKFFHNIRETGFRKSLSDRGLHIEGRGANPYGLAVRFSAQFKIVRIYGQPIYFPAK